MSAFMVANYTINRVASRIYHDRDASWTRSQLSKAFGIPEGPDRDASARQLGGLMFALNIRGVNDRYGSDQAQTFRALNYAYQYAVTDKIQTLKSLRCWLYQCNEGDTDEQELFRILDDYSHHLALEIVAELPAYEKAEWD